MSGRLLFFVLFFISQVGVAQKLKYKDIYPFLVNEDYTQVDSLLLRFVTENPEDASANLEAGRMLDYQTRKLDPIKQTKEISSKSDSAIFYYGKALVYLNEKEVKKNDEFYQFYNRRDLRTGKLGVKLTDIQYDLQKRMEELGLWRSLSTKSNQSLVTAKRQYEQARTSYIELNASVPDFNRLLLRANDLTLKSLKYMVQNEDSSKQTFIALQKSLKNLNNQEYAQTVNWNKIETIQAGTTDSDFYTSTINLWDYALWSKGITQKIDDTILPLRQSLNEVYAAISQNDGSDTLSFQAINDPDLKNAITELDPSSTALQIIDLGILDLWAQWYEQENHPLLTDSTNIDLLMDYYGSYISILKQKKEKSNVILQSSLDEVALDYASFIETNFINVEGLSDFLSQQRDSSNLLISLNMQTYDSLLEKGKWAYTKSDTLPMFVQPRDTSIYVNTLGHIKSDSAHYILGEKASVNKIYVARVNPSRVAEWVKEIDMPLGSLPDKERTYKISETQEGSLIVSMQYETKDGMNTLLLGYDIKGNSTFAESFTLDEPISKIAIENHNITLILEDGAEKKFSSKGEALTQ